MPLPSDKKLLTLSEDLLAAFDTVFGLHPGFRPAHARGVVLTGSFTPTPDAAILSNAPHFSHSSTPITVRFSSFTGLPLIPDNDANANPRGFAIRFHLGEHVHTDIVAHSTPAFPTRDGEEFLQFLRALSSSPPGAPSPTPIESFLGSHPAALAFAQMPKPSPSSYAREAYYGLSAMKFTNGKGDSCFGRYSIVPDAGIEHVDEPALKSKSPNFLFDELPQRIAQNPVSFQLLAQLAKEGDQVDDVTVIWPEDRPVKNLGKITINAVVADSDREQKRLIFDPIPRVQGIEASDDPLFEVRAALYLISGRRRRAAPEA
jgi:catalase